MLTTDEVSTLQRRITSGGYSTIIFDLDETLTYLIFPWGEWTARVTAALPADARVGFRRRLADPTESEGALLNEYIEAYPDFYDQLITITNEFEARHFGEHHPHDGLVSLLPQLHEAGIRLVLWTSQSHGAAESALAELGLAERFDTIVSRNDVRLAKPNPEGWRLIWDGTSPLAHHLFVGDSNNDERVAAAIGIDYFQINHYK